MTGQIWALTVKAVPEGWSLFASLGIFALGLAGLVIARRFGMIKTRLQEGSGGKPEIRPGSSGPWVSSIFRPASYLLRRKSSRPQSVLTRGI
jgi:hypothetical protein